MVWLSLYSAWAASTYSFSSFSSFRSRPSFPPWRSLKKNRFVVLRCSLSTSLASDFLDCCVSARRCHVQNHTHLFLTSSCRRFSRSARSLSMTFIKSFVSRNSAGALSSSVIARNNLPCWVLRRQLRDLHWLKSYTNLVCYTWYVCRIHHEVSRSWSDEIAKSESLCLREEPAGCFRRAFCADYDFILQLWSALATMTLIAVSLYTKVGFWHSNW